MITPDTFGQGFPTSGGGADPRAIIDDPCFTNVLPVGVVGVNVGFDNLRNCRTMTGGASYDTPTAPLNGPLIFTASFELATAGIASGNVIFDFLNHTRANRIRLIYQTDGNIVWYAPNGNVLDSSGANWQFDQLRWHVEMDGSGLVQGGGRRGIYSNLYERATMIETVQAGTGWRENVANNLDSTNGNWRTGDTLSIHIELDSAQLMRLYRFRFYQGSITAT